VEHFRDRAEFRAEVIKGKGHPEEACRFPGEPGGIETEVEGIPEHGHDQSQPKESSTG
jgi:hypothetical protein